MRTVVVPTASTRLRCADSLPRRRRDLVALAVHRMLLERVLGDRSERVEADVEGHALDVEQPEQLGREVQAGRRCGGGAGVARIDRLVARGIRRAER